MDRRRALGIALAAVSACGYGSGPLFAKSVYGAGLGWLKSADLTVRRPRFGGIRQESAD